MLFMPLVGYVEPNQAMQDIAADVRMALALSNVSVKEAADYMRLDLEAFRKQLHCAPGHHLSVFRLVLMPRAFQQHFLMLHARRVGLTVLEPGQIAAAMEALTRWMKPVKADLRETHEKEKTA